MRAALFAGVVLALMIAVLRGGGLRPVSATQAPPEEEVAVLQVQSFAPIPGNPDTIAQRIDRVIAGSKRAGFTEEVVGWSTEPLGERRYSVHFAVKEDGTWIGAEWIVNLSNGWVHPANQYASWLMFDRSW